MTAATNPRPGRSTLVAALGTILFVLFVGPGPVIGLVPLLLSGWRLRPPLLGWEPFRFIGVALLLLLGLPVLVDALVRFVRRGRGTPAPVAPPERLVAVGAYRYVRNPMYVAVVVMILGQALLLGSLPVLVYAAGAFLAFHLFVVLY
jgi:protein-S-isoprenylcysteine O-methyltransferase Ste14